MRKIENEFDAFVYEYYGDKLDTIDKEIEIKAKKIEIKDKIIEIKAKEIEIKEQKINKLKKQIKKLNELDDLNTPEAQKIIDKLISMSETPI